MVIVPETHNDRVVVTPTLSRQELVKDANETATNPMDEIKLRNAEPPCFAGLPENSIIVPSTKNLFSVRLWEKPAEEVSHVPTKERYQYNVNSD